MMRWTLGPVLRRSTPRRWAYLVFGGAMLVPPLVFAAVGVPAVVPISTGLGDRHRNRAGGGGAVGCSFVPAVRVLEGAAVRALLDDPAPDAKVDDPAVRLRASALSVVLPVLLVLSLPAPFTGVLRTRGAAAR
ncbi:hypothetical protein OOZ19_02455 [Saccharopolyspora sp. NFXS83]|uniref:hypothetical protein n=1 Tax=Saccharopolyspora sp. NFXS83 TaxID=2993560 RepID=UPI00224B2E5B|nr:hypothetical protein [Saccharopolyspora sp. NFXS83]MCX2729092.1 hypothetical protein [Saccharopolyspora sp. NFXS83]